MPSLLQTWALPIALLAITNVAATWYKLVSEHVPEPYLDEFFHVPQAQRYCKGDYTWDPKITTPPGLYLVSLLLKPLIDPNCDISSLRLVNVGGICLICLAAYDVLYNLRQSNTSRGEKQGQGKTSSIASGNDQTSTFDANTALNISLFPPLFFFSGLYYTDVISTLFALLSYSAFLKQKNGNWKARNAILSFLLGAVALLFRQTNIFWVAVFPAGLAVVETLKTNGAFNNNEKQPSATDIISKSWTEGLVYDVEVGSAELQDYALVVISVALAAIRNPLVLLRAIIPYLLLLGLFASFVAWNGGVVLGDKSNHVATIHTPQMLYFWVYTAFFSIAAILPTLFATILRYVPESRLKSLCNDNLTGSSNAAPPRIISTVLFLTLGMASVHYNTIVHPFTLADNRHYVFYVFRILNRHPAIKYAAVPVYLLCAWLVIQCLGRCAPNKAKQQLSKPPQPTITEDCKPPCQASFILVWMATTTLSLVSAPLVEPRYFIIPWIIWRVQVPYISRVRYDLRLPLETAWHLAINVITGYVFLYRGFTWPSEPGKVQRFLY